MIMKVIKKEIIKKAPLAMVICEAVYSDQGLPVDYRTLDANELFEKNLGLKKADIAGKYISEWLFESEETRASWTSAFVELSSTEGQKEFNEILKLKDQWYLLVAFVPSSGYLVILFRNVTSLKNAEIALEEKQVALDASRALSQSIFDNSPFAVIIYSVSGTGASSKDYIIQGVNAACLKMENWHIEDVIGKPLREVRPGVEEFGIVDMFRQVFETGKTVHYPAKIYKDDGWHRWYENTIFKLPTGEIVAAYDDVTEAKQAEEDHFAEKERLKVTLYSIGDGVITTDRQGRVEMMNLIAENLTGWKQDEVKGKNLADVFDIYNEANGMRCESPVEQVLETGSIVELANHTILRAKDGSKKAISDSAAPIKNQQGEILGVVLVFRDVTEAKEKEAKIEFLSYRDSLTGLYNRTFFEKELKRLDEEKQLPLTFIMGDLDGLKLINDVFGHQTGDKALVKIANLFSSFCRETDVISRWGGDEFVVLLPKTQKEIGQKICDRIKSNCRYLTVADTRLSISLGCASKNNAKEKWADVLKNAEDNMYKSKLLGAQSYRSIILNSIKNALFEKSYETEEHGERLGRFCREIAKDMGLPSFITDELEVLAMLHDIGKIGIDDGILKKAGPLTDEEWLIMKKHPEIGYRIAQTVPDLSNIAEYILTHHERWDGKGYPRGLIGEEIPLLSRILAVADAYDAMTQDGPYRKALSPEYAKEELRVNAGSQFDPEIVNIFIEYLDGNVN
ncbi:MAG TPA: diguanylate cyclase [Bacillota bacterium]|nr:diguanylate cyclase [Bacillota bacterium]